MKIRLKAFARFREIMGAEQVLEVPEGTTLRGVLVLAVEGSGNVRDALFTGNDLKEYVVLMRNRKRVMRADADREVLSDGDEVAVFPPVAGG
jgi:molybdopterin synthase sulfur carrier subunit